MQTLPRLVLALTHNYDAWVVGSAADPENINPRDYDVVVPYYSWGPAAHLIPLDAKPNTFGGWKCISSGAEVDVWPGDLGFIMNNARSSWAWQPATGVRLKKLT